MEEPVKKKRRRKKKKKVPPPAKIKPPRAAKVIIPKKQRGFPHEERSLLELTARHAWRTLVSDPEFKGAPNPDWYLFPEFIRDLGMPKEPGQLIVKYPSCIRFTKLTVHWYKSPSDTVTPEGYRDFYELEECDLCRLPEYSLLRRI